jgi:hypothetical protein
MMQLVTRGFALGLGLLLVVPAVALGDVTIIDHPPAYTNQPNVTFTFSGPSPYECSVDSATYSPCDTPLYLTGLSEGSHSLSVRTQSLNGGSNPATTVSWTEDFTPPNTILDQAPPALTNQTTATFDFSSSDRTATFVCSLNGSTPMACASPVTYSGLTAGKRTFTVHAVDPAGNYDIAGQAVTWTIDLTPPQTTIDHGPQTLANSRSATFGFSSSKGGSTFLCSLDGATPAACSSPVSFSNLADGSHTFHVQAIDPAGNADPTPASETWTIDTTPPASPTVTLSSFSPPPLRTPAHARLAGDESKPGFRPPTVLPPITIRPRNLLGDWTLAPQARLQWSDSDSKVDHYVVYEVSDGTQSTLLDPAPAGGTIVSLPEGTSCFFVSAVDGAGNQADSESVCTSRPLGWPAIVKTSREAFPGDLVAGPGYWDDTYRALGVQPVWLWLGHDDCNGNVGCYPDPSTHTKIESVAIVATTCPTCGSIRFELSGGAKPVCKPASCPPGAKVISSVPDLVSYSRVLNLTSPSVHHRLYVLPSVKGDANNVNLWIRRLTAYPRIEAVGWVLASDVGA